MQLEFANDLPIVYGSTGTWTLLLTITSLATFSKMKATNSLFPDIFQEMPNVSIHLFCFETYDTNADMHARHFSSPFSGIVEDPVTGTASGVMGAYFANYISENVEKELHLIIEQGQEVTRDGRVAVTVSGTQNHLDITITGTAVYVQEFDVILREIMKFSRSQSFTLKL